MKKIVEVLQGLNPNVDWENETGLIDKGHIDSFDMIMLVSDLSEAFAVAIEMEHLEPENFNSVADIAGLIRQLGGKV